MVSSGVPDEMPDQLTRRYARKTAERMSLRFQASMLERRGINAFEPSLPEQTGGLSDRQRETGARPGDKMRKFRFFE